MYWFDVNWFDLNAYPAGFVGVAWPGHVSCLMWGASAADSAQRQGRGAPAAAVCGRVCRAHVATFHAEKLHVCICCPRRCIRGGRGRAARAGPGRSAGGGGSCRRARGAGGLTCKYRHLSRPRRLIPFSRNCNLGNWRQDRGPEGSGCGASGGHQPGSQGASTFQLRGVQNRRFPQEQARSLRVKRGCFSRSSSVASCACPLLHCPASPCSVALNCA